MQYQYEAIKRDKDHFEEIVKYESHFCSENKIVTLNEEKNEFEKLQIDLIEGKNKSDKLQNELSEARVSLKKILKLK